MVVQGYKADQEASFTSLGFGNHLRKFNQTVKFAGTGGHHQNGIAEKAIQDVMSIARVQLLHAAIMWPEVADAQLWPQSVDLAEFVHIHMPRSDTGLSTFDLFTQQR